MRLPWVSREMHEALCAEKDARIADLQKALRPTVSMISEAGRAQLTMQDPADVKPKSDALPPVVLAAIRQRNYSQATIAQNTRWANQMLRQDMDPSEIADRILRGEQVT